MISMVQCWLWMPCWCCGPLVLARPKVASALLLHVPTACSNSNLKGQRISQLRGLTKRVVSSRLCNNALAMKLHVLNVTRIIMPRQCPMGQTMADNITNSSPAAAAVASSQSCCRCSARPSSCSSSSCCSRSCRYSCSRRRCRPASTSSKHPNTLRYPMYSENGGHGMHLAFTVPGS